MRSVFLALALLGAAAASAATTATLAWVAPTLNTDGTPIAGPITYNVYYAPQGTLPGPAKQFGLTATSATVTVGLTAGSTQCFTVSAVVGGMESAPSTATCSVIPKSTPGLPTNLTVIIK